MSQVVAVKAPVERHEKPAPHPAGRRQSRGGLTVGLEPIAALREEWDALLERSRTRSVFMSWTFLCTWWEHFHRRRQPRVWVVRDGEGRTVAILPLYLEVRTLRLGTVRVLRNMGFGDVVNPDFLDAIVERDRECEVAPLLLAALEADTEWEYAEFSELSPGGSMLLLADQWERLGVFESRVERRARCPYITLPDSFDAFLKSCNSHFRQQLRRYRRKIERDLSVEWKQVGVDVDVAAGIEALAKLHQERMEATDRGGNFRKQDYLVFHRDLAERMVQSGQLYFWLLYVDGAPMATHFGYLDAGVYYGYQMGFSPRYHKWSPGHYMTGVVLEKLIALGAREMNLLRGTDAWKFRWTRKSRDTQALSLIRRSRLSSWAWIRANLSAPPAIALRFALGRDAFEQLREALATFRRRMQGGSAS
ncbi:MAG: GNAT family N-acetyltransferase [Acidobacteriota bacterium]|nr:GNAT family N-acetyltransferase [Acidobacteriota bacterium]